MHRTAAIHQQMEEALPRSLFCEQIVVPHIEVGEVVVATIGNRRGEVGPVLLLEHKKSRGVVEAKELQFRHAGMLWNLIGRCR